MDKAGRVVGGSAVVSKSYCNVVQTFTRLASKELISSAHVGEYLGRSTFTFHPKCDLTMINVMINVNHQVWGF